MLSRQQMVTSFQLNICHLKMVKSIAHSQEFPFLRRINDGWVDKGVGFLVFISGFTISVIPYLDIYYLFDSHSRNGQGSMVPQDKPVLLILVGLQDMEKYVQVVCLQERNQNHAYFQI